MSRVSPIFLVCLGIALLSAMDAAVKVVALDETVLTATWLRYVFGGIILIPLVAVLQRPMPGRRGLAIHALRGFLLAFTSLSFFYAISILSLAETITIAFVAPLIVPPLAALVLKEPMRGRVALAAIAGFLGVLVTVQGADAAMDGGAARPWAIAAAILSAVLYAAQTLILRARAQRDDALAIAALATVVPIIVLTPLALAFDPLPAVPSLGPAFLSGLFGALGVIVMVWAYARAEAQVMILYEYTGLFWAALFGWVLFREVPRIEIFAGAAIIAGACLWIAWTERAPRPLPQKKSAF
ncbi:MAG: DMT family transporter [Pseudomonadota bacterium]